jgi:uncharacterized protein (DUF736 family)
MATTGNAFTGTIKTLNLNVKAKLVRIEMPLRQGPTVPHLLGCS